MSTTAPIICQTLQQRMARMASVDRIWATGFILALWVVYLFTFFQIAPVVEAGGVVTVLLIGGALVLAFTTASVIAMMKQFSDNLDATYESDIRHLDEKRQRGRSD